MSIRDSIRSITEFSHKPVVRVLLLSAYYLAIIVGLIMLYGKGDISSSNFVYQGF